MKSAFILSGLILLVSCVVPEKEHTPSESVKPLFPTAVDQGNVNYADYFAANTMRLDFYHSGTATEEHFALDRVLNDGPWPGSMNVLIDPLRFGPYFFEVADAKSGRLLYSRGFANIFGEWQTTPEAAEGWGTFHESLRFPWPLNPVDVILKKRDSGNNFQPVWSVTVDPSSRQVNTALLHHPERTGVIYENGPSVGKLDLVLLGDGYTEGEMQKFRDDARRMTDILLSHEPFLSHKGDINVRYVETPSSQTGVHRPHPGVHRRTPLSAHYSSFDSERYVLSYDNRTLRNVGSAVPYDFMVILINERNYGGGGIYNLYTTVSVDNQFAGYIMVHELGHGLAGLADEYYTSSVAYEAPKLTVEPWEVNITALFDQSSIKWKELVDEGTPIPTPWNKEPFDRFGYSIQKERDSIRQAQLPEAVMEALFIRQMAREDEFFSEEKYAGKVGAFEGAGYLQKGLYRSQLDCIMFTRHMHFCKVCQKGLGDVMKTYTE